MEPEQLLEVSMLLEREGFGWPCLVLVVVESCCYVVVVVVEAGSAPSVVASSSALRDDEAARVLGVYCVHLDAAVVHL